MKIISFFLIFLILLTGCETKQVLEEEITPVNLIENTSQMEIYNLFFEDNEYMLKKYEPKENSYLGIFLEETTGSFISNFEDETKIKNAIYIYDLKLDSEFPLSWVLNCYSKYKTPLITIYPPEDISQTYNTQLLEELSKDFGALNIPIFVNFYPLTQWLSPYPDAYKDFLKTAYTFFQTNAENVCFIWSIDSNLVYNTLLYYPGDDYTDWVGINIYEDISKDDRLEIVFDELDIFYKIFQETKPIAISSLAISHFSNNSFNYNISQKIDELERFLSSVPNKYPRIKMINYINTSNIKNIELENRQNYSITDNSEILKTYQTLVENGRFSSSVVLTSENSRSSVEKIKTSYIVYKKNDTFYVDSNTLINLGYIGHTHSLEEYDIDGKTLYNLDDFLNSASLNKIVYENAKNIILKDDD